MPSGLAAARISLYPGWVSGRRRVAERAGPLEAVLLSDHQDVIAKISDVLRAMGGPIAAYDKPILAGTSIVRDLKLDSLAVMDFVMALETEFDTIIPIEALSSVETVGDLALLLEPQAAHAAAGL